MVISRLIECGQIEKYVFIDRKSSCSFDEKRVRGKPSPWMSGELKRSFRERDYQLLNLRLGERIKSFLNRVCPYLKV